MKVYHIIKESKPQYELGQSVVSPFSSRRDFSHWESYKQKAESLLEIERLKSHPNYPSRYNSLFVSETLENAEAWARWKYRMGATYYLYELDIVEGKVYYFDTDWFESLAELMSNGELPRTHNHSIEECVSQFWTGAPFRSSGYSLKEGMLKGKANVISKRKFLIDGFKRNIIEI